MAIPPSTEEFINMAELILPSQVQPGRLTAEQHDLLQENAKLLATGNTSDCVARCEDTDFEDTDFRLHRRIICERSGFFEACFRNGFMESLSGLVDIQEYVTWPILWLIIGYMYMSIPQAGFHLEVYEPLNDSQFYELMFELYRQADYLQVRDLTGAIIEELRRRLNGSTRRLWRMERDGTLSAFAEAVEDPMTAAIVAYDKTNLYYDSYEPLRATIFSWIEHCYPILSRLDGFDNYLRQAPELMIAIIDMMRNLDSSKVITPGPLVRCMFCNDRIWPGDPFDDVLENHSFGILADDGGHVNYFCRRPACFYKMISIKKCFRGE